MMFASAKPELGKPWVCARCERAPGHVDDLEAFGVGYTSSRRELHGCEPFTVCAACMRLEAHDAYRGNVAWWMGLGGAEADVLAMLTRPA